MITAHNLKEKSDQRGRGGGGGGEREREEEENRDAHWSFPYIHIGNSL